MSAQFHPRATGIYISAQVPDPRGDVTVRLLLDTGSAVTCLRRTVLDRLGIDLSSPRAIMPIASATTETTAPLFTVHRVEALGTARNGLGVIGLPLPPGVRADGVLGLNFFRGTRLVIDFRAGAVRLE